MSEKIWFLKHCPLFERLTPEESKRLDARSSTRTLRKKEFVYFPNEPGESILVLARGRVKINIVSAGGRETIFAFIEPGEIFGELAILDGNPRNEFAEAVEASTVLAVPRDEILWLMGHRPDVALHISKLLGFRVRRVENRLHNLLFRSVRERAIALLLEFVSSHGRSDGGRWEIRLRLSHQDFANLIGSTRETVTATLGQLQREGLIEIRRRRIFVLDRQRLAAESSRSDSVGLVGSRSTTPPAPAQSRVSQ